MMLELIRNAVPGLTRDLDPKGGALTIEVPAQGRDCGDTQP